MSQEIVAAPSGSLSAVTGDSMAVPRMIGDAGDRAARRFLEFFAATIRNRNTRTAYYHACMRFFAWCDLHKLGEIDDIEPLHVAAYIEALGRDSSRHHHVPVGDEGGLFRDLLINRDLDGSVPKPLAPDVMHGAQESFGPPGIAMHRRRAAAISAADAVRRRTELRAINASNRAYWEKRNG